MIGSSVTHIKDPQTHFYRSNFAMKLTEFESGDCSHKDQSKNQHWFIKMRIDNK